jgi:hypothetical protein
MELMTTVASVVIQCRMIKIHLIQCAVKVIQLNQ